MNELLHRVGVTVGVVVVAAMVSGSCTAIRVAEQTSAEAPLELAVDSPAAPVASEAAPSTTVPGRTLGAGDAPDPHVLRVGSTYYAFTTMSGFDSVPVWRSDDLTTWTWVGDGMPTNPAWTEWGHTWAPGVIEAGGRYVLFFAGRDSASGQQCVGVASSDRPEGPFTAADRPLVCDVAAGGSIDPYPFPDHDGSAYLYWKTDANAIGNRCSLWGARLTPDRLAVEGDPVELLREDATWEHPTVENPAMVLFGGTYFLFYSGGWWESARYATGYATCATPLGPCEKQTTAEPWLATVDGLVGVGGATFFTTENGTPLMAAHGWTEAAVGYELGGARQLVVVPLAFTGPSGQQPTVACSPNWRTPRTPHS